MSKKRNDKSFLDILIRYLILILVGIPHLWFFYLIFTRLTVYPVYFLVDIFYNVSLSGSIITIENIFPIEIIHACVAGSAYYLLLIFNLATPGITLSKRFKMILSSFAVLLLLNIMRIFILSLVFVSGSSFFDIAHKLFWYAGSIIFVVAIWFAEVKFFKIKEIPFYSDLKFLYKISSLRK